jgi:uncharacterized membrane protein YebE (DUF533 family)
MSEGQQPLPGSHKGNEEPGPPAGEQNGVTSLSEQPRVPAGEPPDVASASQPPRPQVGAPPEHDETIVQVLASKILGNWLRNRQQLLVPFTLDLQKLDSAEVDVLMHAMVAAAYASGDLVEKSRERLDAALERLNADAAQREAFLQALNAPKALPDALANVRDVSVGAMVYAAALLAIDRRQLVNRHFMRYLAARLDLSAQLARSLEQRFRPAV